MTTRIRHGGIGIGHADVMSIGHRPAPQDVIDSVTTTIVTPTLGRESLARAAASAIPRSSVR